MLFTFTRIDSLHFEIARDFSSRHLLKYDQWYIFFDITVLREMICWFIVVWTVMSYLCLTNLSKYFHQQGRHNRTSCCFLWAAYLFKVSIFVNFERITFVGVIFFQGTHFLLQVLLFCCFFEIAFYNILLEWFCLAIGYRKFNRKFFRYFLIAPNDVKVPF